MIAHIVYGRKRSVIDIGEAFIMCPACDSYKWADIMVMSIYFHIYWIPIFPIDKDVNIVCHDCGLKRYEIPFNNKLKTNFDEIKHQYKHRWYTYLGIGIFALIVLSIIFSRSV